MIQLHFNSNMVRLKDIVAVLSAKYDLFQFQYGSIKRLNGTTRALTLFEFQFQYGSIKSNATLPTEFMYTAISIPIWFD